MRIGLPFALVAGLSGCRATLEVALPVPGTETLPWVAVQARARGVAVEWAAFPGATAYTVLVTTTEGAPIATLPVSCDSDAACSAPVVVPLLSGSVAVRVENPSGPGITQQAAVPLIPAGWQSAPPSRAPWTHPALSDANNSYGHVLLGTGDVDADGFDDFLVGAYSYSVDVNDGGRAELFRGGPSGPSPTPVMTPQGAATSEFFGLAAAAAGDLDGDGTADFFVASPRSNGVAPTGSIRRFRGVAQGLPVPSGDVGPSDVTVSGQFGHALAAGEFDGLPGRDVLVSEWLWDSSVTDQGRVMLLSSAKGPAVQWIAGPSTAGNGLFAETLAGLGDAIEGGTDEWAISRCTGSCGAVGDAWSASLYSGMGKLQDFPNGRRVAAAGDVNGDGRGDLLVGFVDGHVELHLGAAMAPLLLGRAVTAAPIGGSSSFGGRICGAGDLNGDGFADIAIGDSSFDDPNTQGLEGRVLVFYGQSGDTGIAAQPSFAITGQGGTRLSRCGMAGDVDGDGSGDLLVGSNQEIRLYYGPASAAPRIDPILSRPALEDGVVSVRPTAEAALHRQPLACEVRWGAELPEAVGCGDATSRALLPGKYAIAVTVRDRDGYSAQAVFPLVVPDP